VLASAKAAVEVRFKKTDEFREKTCNLQQFQTRNAAYLGILSTSLAEQVGFCASEQSLTQCPLGSRFANVRFLPAHLERNVEGDGESLLAFYVHPENARRVRVTINQRTLVDSFWPALKRIGLAEGAL
jgi:hypothetical protein